MGTPSAAAPGGKRRRPNGRSRNRPHRDRAGRTSSAAPRNAVPGAAGRKAQDTAKTPVASAKTSIRGRVELSPALKGKVEPNDTVFIFARAIDGPRMPLAALRARAADLPIDFSLDDSQAL